MLLSLEAFGNGEDGPVAATVRIDTTARASLLFLASTFRAVKAMLKDPQDPGLLRLVCDDTIGAKYYVQDGKDDAIDDFVNETSGCGIIEKVPGQSNLQVDTRTIQVSAKSDGSIQFRFVATVKGTNQEIYTHHLDEFLIRG